MTNAETRSWNQNKEQQLQDQDKAIQITLSNSEDTVTVLEQNDVHVEDPCQDVYGAMDMICMGQCDNSDINHIPTTYYQQGEIFSSKWEAAQVEIDNFNVPTTHRWPLVVVDRAKTSKASHHSGTSLPSLVTGCASSSSSSHVKPEIVDVVFVDQDKFSCVYAIEVCSSPTNKITELYAFK